MAMAMSQNYGTDKADFIMLFISIIQFWVVNNFESLKHMAAKPSDSVWGMYNLPVNDVMMDGEEEIGAGVQVNFDQARMYDAWRLEDSGGVLWKDSSSNNHASVDIGIQWVPWRRYDRVNVLLNQGVMSGKVSLDTLMLV